MAAAVGAAAGGGVRPGSGRAGWRRAGGSGRRPCCGRRAGSRTRRCPLGLEAVPEVLLHPSAAERFTRCAPGCPAWRGGRCARTCGSPAAGWCRSCIRRICRCPGSGPRHRTARRRSRAISRSPMPSPRRSGGCGRPGWLPGRPRRLIRGDLREMRGTDVACRSGGVIVSVHGARPRRAGPVPLPRPAAGRGAVRRDRAGLRRDRSRRRNLTTPLIRAWTAGRACPAGHLPAARDLAGRLRRAAGAGHVHARRRDQLLPAARRPGAALEPAGEARAVALLGAARGHDPAGSVRGGHRRSGVAARIEALLPAGVRPRQLRVRTLLAGMCLAQADHRPPT